MDEGIKFFIGLDAHKDSTSVAACEAGREPARFAGTVGPDVRPLLKVLSKAGDPAQVSVVYEAGPTGYGLYRELRRRGYRCEIVAPSLIPRRPGDRVKNDRRDCARLAELSRAGELKPIWVPDEAHEAMRNLWRAREDGLGMRLRARQQLKAFLLRHARRYPARRRGPRATNAGSRSSASITRPTASRWPNTNSPPSRLISVCSD